MVTFNVTYTLAEVASIRRTITFLNGIIKVVLLYRNTQEVQETGRDIFPVIHYLWQGREN